jgi:hypothetical protein
MKTTVVFMLVGLGVVVVLSHPYNNNNNNGDNREHHTGANISNNRLQKATLFYE